MSRIVFFLKNNTDLNLFKDKGKQNISCLPCLLKLVQEERAIPIRTFHYLLTLSPL